MSDGDGTRHTALTRRASLLAATGALAAAAVPRPAARAATPADTAVMAKAIDDITSLDPHESFEQSSGEVIANVYERLVLPDPAKPSELKGELAESWEVSDGGATFAFTLRPDRVFASGRPVTAVDVAFSLRRAVLLGKAPAFIVAQLGFTPADVEDRIRAEGDRRVVLRTSGRQAPSFVLYCLTANVASIVDKAAVQQAVAGDDQGNAWLRQNSAGSGPFVLRGWRANEAVTLEANPRHPAIAAQGTRPGAVRRVVIRHVADPAAQFLLLRQGDADIARNLSSDQLGQLAADPLFELVARERAFLMYLALNQTDPVLARPQVRQAVKWAIDYAGIQQSLVPRTWKVHQSFLPDGMPGALSDAPFQRDAAKARALLDQAGVPNGYRLVIDHAATQPYAEVAQAVQGNLSDIGLRTELQAGDQRQVITKTRARQHQAALLYWGSDFFDPHSNAQAFCVNPDNSEAATVRTVAWRNAWQDPSISERAAANVMEADTAKRLALYEQLQRESLERSPFVVLFQQVDTAAIRRTVRFALGGVADRTDYAQIRKG